MEWKRSTSLEFRAWFGLLGKHSRKQRLRCHFFVREGNPREQEGGKEECGQEGQEASSRVRDGAEHSLATNVAGSSCRTIL